MADHYVYNLGPLATVQMNFFIAPAARLIFGGTSPRSFMEADQNLVPRSTETAVGWQHLSHGLVDLTAANFARYMVLLVCKVKKYVNK